MLRKLLLAALACGALLGAGCEPPPLELGPALPTVLAQLEHRDFALEVCEARIAAVRATPSLPGAPELEAQRAAILGRAVGEPVFFVATPPPAADPRRPSERGGARVGRLLRAHRHDKAKLRQALLRGGYVFADEPDEAFALVRDLRLSDLFDDETIYLERGRVRHRLDKQPARLERGHEYRHVEGEQAGRTARLLFGDRVARERAALAAPLHRDLRALRHEVGFDRVRVTHITEAALLAELRFGAEWLPALLESDGAALALGCVSAPAAQRERAERWASERAWKRRATAALAASAEALVAERLPFDRPRNAEDHFSDGQLRPQWEAAYRRGSFSFRHDEEGYAVFDAEGNPSPPQTCVEMVLDSYERASGNWFRKQGEARGRTPGGLDFSKLGVQNRAGVLSFELFAQKTPELFTHRRIPEAERVQFKDRERFFAYLVEHADAFEPGDIVAIQGLKRDGHIHQHAILIRDTDPITGMPFALTDQMKHPRHRSWEGIMAEAPLRSLLYHVEPTPELLRKLDPQPPRAATHVSAGAPPR